MKLVKKLMRSSTRICYRVPGGPTETDKPTSQIYSPKHYSFEGTDIVRQEDHDGPISLT